MTNVTDIVCPHCKHNKADTLAIKGQADGNKMKKTVLYRCLNCHNQFETPLQSNNVNYRKFFKPEAYEGDV